jgi:hypothetical protein
MSKHTPIPWTFKLWKFGIYRIMTGNKVIAERVFAVDDQDDGSANAAFICQAVNSHAQLVEALFAALVLCNTMTKAERTIAYDGKTDFDPADKILEALKAAGGVCPESFEERRR